jgi:hypothetical protein
MTDAYPMSLRAFQTTQELADALRARCNKLTKKEREYSFECGMSRIYTPFIYVVSGVCFEHRVRFDYNGMFGGTRLDAKIFGWFHTRQRAVKALTSELVEAKFDYAVIEATPAGVYATPIRQHWYRWSDKKDRWFAIKRPKASEGLVNFGI